MIENTSSVARPRTGAIEINRVLKNTYMLLGATLIFSALMAYVAILTRVPPMSPFLTLIGFYGLLFAVSKMRNSGMGIVLTFALTGFMGFSLGPILGYVAAFAPDVLMTALGGTGLLFFALSGYVLVTRKDMNFLTGFLMTGFWVLLISMVANLFFNIPALGLAISAGFILFSSAIILYQTSAIIRGGETNYVMATVTLFVSLYNIFISLLSILMAFSGNR